MGASGLHKKQGVLRKNEGLISLWHYVYKDDRGLLDTSKQKQNQILIKKKKPFIKARTALIRSSSAAETKMVL